MKHLGVLTLTALVGACGSSEEDSPPVPVAPETIAGTHESGKSPCPQPLGSVRITNNQSSAFTYSATGTDFVEASPLEGEVQPGQTADVALAFTCRSKDSFENTVRLTFVRGFQSLGTRDIRVSVTVQPFQ